MSIILDLFFGIKSQSKKIIISNNKIRSARIKPNNRKIRIIKGNNKAIRILCLSLSNFFPSIWMFESLK